MASGAPGSAPGQKFWVFIFSPVVIGNSNQYTDFHASTIPGSVLHHISSVVRGPWLRPWTEIFGFRNFSFGFVVNPITVQTFQLPRPSGMPWNFFPCKTYGGLGGPWHRPLTEILDFHIFPCSFRTTVITNQ